jgi:hexosaminidase
VKKSKHFIYLVAIVMIMSFHASALPQQELHLMPMPEEVHVCSGKLPIDVSFAVRLSGHSDPHLKRAVQRLLQRLQKKTGIPMFSEPIAGVEPKQATLQILCDGSGESVQSVRTDESYRLEITEQQARLSAPSPVGVLRGMETFLQLVDIDGESFFVPCVQINDRPRFRWRGLLIDVSRHFEPVEIIRRNLDAMAAVKMNVFHWHLSDDQGFRIESKKFPKLHQRGSDGKYYTQAEVREIVSYAGDRGIRVVPEFDMPGHSTSWLVAYPELASAPGPYEIERSWGVFDPCLDPTRDKTYAFLEAFIGEMARLFPDAYFHIGGDEVNGKQWNANPRIRAFKLRHHLKDNRALQAYFNRRLQRILAKHGKRMLGWHEILHPDLPKSVLVQLWQRQPSLADIARRGYAGILSFGYYLDHMQPASFHYEMDPLGKDADKLTTEERDRIWGGEACMWAEFVTPDNIESRIWPRTAAIAERLWSSAGLTDVEDMYERIEYLSRELEILGLQQRSTHMEILQRMSGDQNVIPLKKLSELLIPTGLGTRMKARKYTSLTPLNRMVDTVWPESESARLFDRRVQQFLDDRSDSAEILRSLRKTLSEWRENEAPVKSIIEQSYLLQEIIPVSETIFELCSKGLQALDYLDSRQKAPETWRKETEALISRAEQPQAEMLPAIVGSIKKLAEAAY